MSEDETKPKKLSDKDAMELFERSLAENARAYEKLQEIEEQENLAGDRQPPLIEEVETASPQPPITPRTAYEHPPSRDVLSSCTVDNGSASDPERDDNSDISHKTFSVLLEKTLKEYAPLLAKLADLEALEKRMGFPLTPEAVPVRHTCTNGHEWQAVMIPGEPGETFRYVDAYGFLCPQCRAMRLEDEPI